MTDGKDSAPEEPLPELREALRLSPHNIALRQHLAEKLLGRGKYAEAEKEFREALAEAPNSLSLKLGLARAFHQQGKANHAIVIVEDLVKNTSAPPRAFLLHARLLAGIGEIAQSVTQYRRAVELDASLADPEFAERLGINAREETSEVVEGKV